MKNTIILMLAVCLFATITAIAQPKGYKKTPTGLVYQFHKDVEGPKGNKGDIIKLNFVFKTDKDSILRSTFAEGTPVEMQLNPGAYKASLEEGLMMMSKGDSASFLINADSIFSKMFNAPLPEFLKKGSNVCFVIKMISVLSEDQYKAEQEKLTSGLVAEEDKKIQDYMVANTLIGVKSPSGLYFVQTRSGTGARAESGKKVSVHYTGKLLDGTKFDSSVDRGQPFEFSLGIGQVIKGWDEGVALMSVGEKGFLLIPSRLGYGTKGAGGTIGPNSILVFEVELLDVK